MGVKIVSTAQIEECPKHSLSPAHYAGTGCLCFVEDIRDDAEELARLLGRASEAARTLRDIASAAAGARRYRELDGKVIRDMYEKITGFLDDVPDLMGAIEARSGSIAFKGDE